MAIDIAIVSVKLTNIAAKLARKLKFEKYIDENTPDIDEKTNISTKTTYLSTNWKLPRKISSLSSVTNQNIS